MNDLLKDLDAFTLISCGIIIFFTIGAAIYTWKADNKRLLEHRRIIESLPNIISTLGVIGTFLGITIGLSQFDTRPEELTASIGTLLSGLKTAFWTSLCGMFGSLFLRLFVTDKKYDKQEQGISDMQTAQVAICNAVDNMSKNVVQATQQTAESFKSFTVMQSEKLSKLENDMQNMVLLIDVSLKKIISSEEYLENISKTITRSEERLGEVVDAQSNMVSAQDEMLSVAKNFSQVLRGEVDDIEMHMKETNHLLADKFDEFSVLLKKSNTEALVEVMKTVTEEFQKQMNTLINKLVQENFDQLNKSVEKLNQWQMENKAMIQELTKQYHQMAEDFDGTSITLSKVSDDTRTLTAEGGKLQQLITLLQQVMIDDNKFVEMTVNLEKSAELSKDSMQSLTNSTNSLWQWIDRQKDLANHVAVLTVKLDELNKIRDYAEEFWGATKKNMNEGVGIIKAGTTELNAQIKELDKQFYVRLSATLSELDKCIAAMIDKMR